MHEICRKLCYFRAEIEQTSVFFLQTKVTTDVKRSAKLRVHENEQLRNDVIPVN